MAKRLTRMHVADVQFNQRHTSPLDGVVQRYAGVRVGASVEHYTRQCAGRLGSPCVMNRLDQYALMVTLAKIELETVGGAGL